MQSSDLFRAWTCGGEGEDPGTQTAFSIGLVNRGFGKRATNVGKFFDGLGDDDK